MKQGIGWQASRLCIQSVPDQRENVVTKIYNELNVP